MSCSRRGVDGRGRPHQPSTPRRAVRRPRRAVRRPRRALRRPRRALRRPRPIYRLWTAHGEKSTRVKRVLEMKARQGMIGTSI